MPTRMPTCTLKPHMRTELFYAYLVGGGRAVVLGAHRVGTDAALRHDIAALGADYLNAESDLELVQQLKVAWHYGDRHGERTSHTHTRAVHFRHTRVPNKSIGRQGHKYRLIGRVKIYSILKGV